MGEGRVRVAASVIARVPFEGVEIVGNRGVVADQPAVAGPDVRLDREIEASESGSIAARIMGGPKTYAGFLAFAHTSPVHVRAPGTSHWRAESIGSLIPPAGSEITPCMNACGVSVAVVKSGSANRAARLH